MKSQRDKITVKVAKKQATPRNKITVKVAKQATQKLDQIEAYLRSKDCRPSDVSTGRLIETLVLWKDAQQYLEEQKTARS
jgi:hypothetical protein